MNRRHLGIAVGFLALSIGLVAPAEAGGRRRPAPRPTPRPPVTVTKVTVDNKTTKNLFVQVGDAGTLPDKLGEAQAAGGKMVNAGQKAEFLTVKPGSNDVRATQSPPLNLTNPNASVADGAYTPFTQQYGDSFDVVANKNNIVEIVPQQNNANRMTFNFK